MYETDAFIRHGRRDRNMQDKHGRIFQAAAELFEAHGNDSRVISLYLPRDSLGRIAAQLDPVTELEQRRWAKAERRRALRLADRDADD